MNEYRRRQETFWTVVSTAVFFVTTASSAHLLFGAKGAAIPDVAARKEATAAHERAEACAQCSSLSAKLLGEMRLVRDLGPAITEPDPPPAPEPRGRPARPAPPPPKKKTDDATAWSTVSSAHKLSQKLGACDAVPASGDAPASLIAVRRIGDVPAPATPAHDRAAARAVYDAITRSMDDPAFANLAADIEAECTARTAAATSADDRAAKAFVEAPLPAGLLGRAFAIYAGIGLSVIAFIIGLVSLQLATRRRGLTALAARRLGAARQAGAQAAVLLRLSATSNGGEPGIVIGAGIGGLLFVLVNRTDADWFVVGTMAGLLVGLVVQMILRSYWVSSRFRERALELAEIEKPAIPIVLTLEGIPREKEREFLEYFAKLSDADAAKAVEGLAAQAENRILEAAEARSSTSPARG